MNLNLMDRISRIEAVLGISSRQPSSRSADNTRCQPILPIRAKKCQSQRPISIGVFHNGNKSYFRAYIGKGISKHGRIGQRGWYLGNTADTTCAAAEELAADIAFQWATGTGTVQVDGQTIWQTAYDPRKHASNRLQF